MKSLESVSLLVAVDSRLSGIWRLCTDGSDGFDGSDGVISGHSHSKCCKALDLYNLSIVASPITDRRRISKRLSSITSASSWTPATRPPALIASPKRSQHQRCSALLQKWEHSAPPPKWHFRASVASMPSRLSGSIFHRHKLTCRSEKQTLKPNKLFKNLALFVPKSTNHVATTQRAKSTNTALTRQKQLTRPRALLLPAPVFFADVAASLFHGNLLLHMRQCTEG